MSANDPARALARIPGAAVSPLIKIKPARDPAYLDYIRAQPCCLCLVEGYTEPHHVVLPGEGARGRRASDYCVAPLCGAGNGADNCHGHAQRYELPPEDHVQVISTGWKLLTWWLDAKAEGVV